MDSLEMGDQEGASFASDKSSIFVAVNVLSARRSFFQTSFKQRISFMGRLCLQNMHEINNSRISCFLFDIIKRIWIIWEWNPVQGLLWQYFFFILLSLTGDLYVTIQAPSFHFSCSPIANARLWYNINSDGVLRYVKSTNKSWLESGNARIC